MKRFGLLFLTTIVFVFCNHAKSIDVELKGKVGKYSIEMEIHELNWKRGSFQGSYAYSGKTSRLNINGDVMGSCLFIEESYKDKTTGYFYLEMDVASLKGKWVGTNGSSYEVSLEFVKGGWSDLYVKDLEDFSKETNSSIGGSYGTEHYWLNDWFYTEGNPEMEIGFSGGYALIEELNDSTIRFQVEVVCGPTYHIAFAEGKAFKKDDGYVWNFREEDDDCVIWFRFDGKTVDIEANNHSACYFGARASLGHEFTKISDEVEFEENASLHRIKHGD